MRFKTSQCYCPYCTAEMEPVVLACKPCDLELRGEFRFSARNEFAALKGDDLHFMRIFLQAEGKVKDMEAPLGMTYPTVRARLSELKERMRKAAPIDMPAVQKTSSIKELLESLERGERDFEEVLEEMRTRKEGKKK